MTETHETARRHLAYAHALADAWHALHVLRVVTAIDDITPHDISAPARRAWHAESAQRGVTGVMMRQAWYTTPDMYERAGDAYRDAVDTIDGIVDAPSVGIDDIDAATRTARVALVTARILAERCGANAHDDATLTDALYAIHAVADATAELDGAPPPPWRDG